MPRFVRPLLAAVLIGWGLASPAAAADRAEGYTRAAAASDVPSLAVRDPARAPLPRAVALDAVEPARLAAERGAKARPGTPRKIGFARDLPAGDAGALLDWGPAPAGARAAAVSFRSPQAAGLRLGLAVAALPEAAIVRFYPPGARAAYEVAGRDLLAQMKGAGPGGMFWSPHVDGEAITLEIELPPGVATESVVLAVPRLSHFFDSPLDPEAAAACEMDAQCFPNWSATGNATARMIFVDGSYSYACSGTLLADTAASGTPYFLSAAHCINNQAAASTLQTYWFYRSTSCNSGTLNPGVQTLTSGATLLHSSEATDTAFMRLASNPPAGATYAGWLSSPPAMGGAATALHYPQADMRKISVGATQGFQDCSGGETFSCSPSDAASGAFFSVSFSSGITEGGSSGSGLFVSSGSSQYLIGQLRGGESSCAAPTAADYYGRFDRAYGAALAQWLNPGAAATLTVIKIGDGSVTSAPAGIACGATCSATFSNGDPVTLTAQPGPGQAFTGWGGACSGAGTTCSLTMNTLKSVTASFEPVNGTLGAALDNTVLAWTSGGAQPFVAQGAEFHFGGSAARSGAIGDNQRSYLGTTVTGPGTLSWYWRVSSEQDFDLLSALLDGARQTAISGEVGWTLATLSIPAGTHAVRWEYAKDPSVTEGQDAGWVDQVAFSGSVRPQSGWWWNPAQSGRGFFIEVIEDRAFLAAYLYESDGRATWYASSGVGVYADNVLSGALDRYTGGQTLTGSWHAPVAAQGSGGPVTVRFSDAQHATLTWAGGTVPLQRFEFSPGGLSALPTPGQPETGWWWNPAEGGRGFSVEAQGGLMFLAGYMYDGAGNPIWYLPSGAFSGTAFTGNWAQYGNGQTLTGPYVPATIVNANIGTLTVQFTGSTTATLTLPDGRQIPIERFRF